MLTGMFRPHAAMNSACLISTFAVMIVLLGTDVCSEINDVASASADEPENVASTPRFRSRWATGKVVAVERFGDRFDVRISVDETDQIEVRDETQVYIGPNVTISKTDDLPENVVASGQVVDVCDYGSICNIDPSLDGIANGVPQPGDNVLVRRKCAREVFIVAKHVVLHRGRILRWDEVRDRLAELNEQGLIDPWLRVTNAMQKEQIDRSRDFGGWCEEITGGGFNTGGLSEEISDYYDSITGEDDLRPKAPRKVGAVMANRSPVADAEIVVSTLDGDWIRHLYIENGRLKEPENWPIRTRSAPNGRFAIYPDVDRFQVIVFHDKGFALVNSDQWPKQPEIVLEPWSRISGRFEDPVEFDQRVRFETSRRTNGWVEIRVVVGDTPLFADKSFRNRRIVPGSVGVSRQVKLPDWPRWRVIGISHDSFELTPGESRRISIGPFTDKERKEAEERLRNER